MPLASLEKASAANMADIAEEMVGSTEVQELVATLEQQYDALQPDQPERVPSAEEIAAEFERSWPTARRTKRLIEHRRSPQARWV